MTQVLTSPKTIAELEGVADEIARKRWLDERSRGIGGSEAAAILGLSPWKSPLALFTEKIGLREVEDEIPEYIAWGNYLEPVIAEKYSRVTGRRLFDPGRYNVRWSTEYPWMCCTVDRDILSFDERGEGVLEIKTAAGFKTADWEDEAPLVYQVQLQHCMIVTGRSWGSFAVLFGGQKFDHLDVERNDAFCDYLIEKEEEFWHRVLTNDPPPPDGAESTREALKRLYPKETGTTVALPGIAIEWDDRLQRIKKTAKRLETKQKEYENLIRNAIGDATFGVMPNGERYSLKTIKKGAYGVEAAEFRQLRKVKSK